MKLYAQKSRQTGEIPQKAPANGATRIFLPILSADFAIPAISIHLPTFQCAVAFAYNRNARFDFRSKSSENDVSDQGGKEELLPGKVPIECAAVFCRVMRKVTSIMKNMNVDSFSWEIFESSFLKFLVQDCHF